MNSTKKVISAAAVAAGLGIGTLAGAMFGTPTVSGALESTSAVVAHPGGPRGGPRGVGLETAAETIGITAEELRTALQGGQTMAEVAEANGVEPQAVIDALVAEVEAHIDEQVAAGELTAEQGEQRKAEAAERIATFVNEGGPAGGPGGPGGHRGHGLETAAEAIGITAEELRAALEDGQTVAEVAEANGVDAQTVIDALVAEATERITAFVNGD
jgi:uncharacterized protein YidB (DUF937 family)